MLIAKTLIKPLNNYPKLATGIAFSLLLPACSMLPSSVEKVQELQKDHQYDAALAHYQRLKPEQQQQIDLDALNKARATFEAKRLRYIEKLQKRHEFAKAYQNLNKALKKLPESEILSAQKQAIQDDEQAYLSQHKLQYQMALAEFYINEAPILERLNNVASNNYYYQNLYQKRPAHRQELAEILGTEGLQALGKNHKATALQLLQLANQLQEDERWKKGLNTISHAQKQRFADAHKKQLQQNQAKITQLQKQYEQAFKKEDLHAAQQKLESLGDLSLNNSQSLWLKTKHSELETVVNKKVELHLKRGQILYSKGRIGEALSLWRSVAPLAPENQKLQENIIRAEQFQKRYNELRQ